MSLKSKKGVQSADNALREARLALEEVKKEREEVDEISSFHRVHRLDNHWSARVDMFLKGKSS